MPEQVFPTAVSERKLGIPIHFQLARISNGNSQSNLRHSQHGIARHEESGSA